MGQHALFLDLITTNLRAVPPINKYNIYSLTMEEREERNDTLQANPPYQRLASQVGQENNIKRQHQMLTRLLESTFRDRLTPTRAKRLEC